MPYFNPTSAESEEQHYLKVASDLVQRWAPAPDPEPADYAAKAARAERLVMNYLQQTGGGVLSGKSLSGMSRSFAGDARRAMRSIVREQMGDYYIGAGRSVPIL